MSCKTDLIFAQVQFIVDTPTSVIEYSNLTAGQVTLPNAGGFTFIANAAVVFDTIKVFADGQLLHRNLTDRLSYNTPTIGVSQTEITFTNGDPNNGLNSGTVVTIIFAYLTSVA